MNAEEKRRLKVTAEVMQDNSPVIVDIDIAGAWMIVAALQAVTRYSNLGDYMIVKLTEIARLFQSMIVTAHPEAEELLEAGWNPEMDIERGGPGDLTDLSDEEIAAAIDDDED